MTDYGYPVATDGYLDMPGRPGNYAYVIRDAVSSLTTWEVIVRVQAPVYPHYLIAWEDGEASFSVGFDRKLWINAGGGAWSVGTLPSDWYGKDIWLRGKITAATGVCEFWYSYGDTPTWVVLAGATRAPVVPNLSKSDLLLLGVSQPDYQYPMTGRLYYAEEIVNGTTLFKFSATDDLGGVPDNGDSFLPTTGDLVFIERRDTASAQGYVEFPGTTGNFLEVADSAALTFTGDVLTYTVRVQLRDLTPFLVTTTLFSKLNSFGLGLASDGTWDPWVSDGTAVVHGGTESAVLPADTWVWLRFDLDLAADTVTAQYALDDSFQVPSGWGPLFEGALPASTVFDSTGSLLIGAGATDLPSIEGKLGYLEIQADSEPVFRLDAESLIVAADATEITPSVGSTDIQVRRNPTPRNSGAIVLPGTTGNNVVLDVTDPLPSLDTFCFVLRVALKSWRGLRNQTLLSQWGNGTGEKAFAFQVTPNGELQLRYSSDGNTEAVPIYSGGVISERSARRPLWVAVTQNATAGLAFLTSEDGVLWTKLGPSLTALSIHDSSPAPLCVGEVLQGRGELSQDFLTGQITNVMVTTEPTPSGYPSGVLGTTEVARLGAEHLDVDDDVEEIDMSGGTALLNRSPVPVDFGVLWFPGSKENYLSVSGASLGINYANNFVVELRGAAEDWSPPYDERSLMSKYATADLGWDFLISPQSTLLFRWSTDGTTWHEVESAPIGVRDFYAKRVAFSFSTPNGRFWLSDDGVTWTQLGGVHGVSGPVHLSAGALKIGSGFNGSITNVSIRNGMSVPDGAPLLDTETFLIDQTCLAVDAGVTSFEATTGQTVQIIRADTPVLAGSGWIRLTGTEGNYLSVDAPAAASIVSKASYIFMIAPDKWKPESRQTLIGRWGDDHQHLLELNTEGGFTFWWSPDGVAEASLSSPPVPGAVDGEFRYLAITVDISGATKKLTLLESTDYGNSWTTLLPVSTTTSGGSTLFAGSSDLFIGAANGEADFFAGRLAYLDIRDNVTPAGLPDGETKFWITPASFDVPGSATEFEDANGIVIEVHSAPTPTTPGSIEFSGKQGEYLSSEIPEWTPISTNHQLSIVFRIDFDLDATKGRVIFDRIGSVSLRLQDDTHKLSLSLVQGSTTVEYLCTTAVVEGDHWYAVTVTGLTVRFWQSEDLVLPNGTVVPPGDDDWVLMSKVTMTSTPVVLPALTVRISSYLTLVTPLEIGRSLTASLTEFWIYSGVVTGDADHEGLPLQTTPIFGFDLWATYMLADDSEAFIANTGHLVAAIGDTLTIEPTEAGPAAYITTSPGGPVVTLTPAPPGPTLSLVPSFPGSELRIVPSPVVPGLSLVSPTLDRSWWPGSENEDPSRWWQQPAFTVQRTIEGVVSGGDYVRGSTNVRTQKTALKTSTSLQGWTSSGVGKGVLYAHPWLGSKNMVGNPYGVVEIEWNLPDELLRNDVWSEVCIVRSAFGNPSTVNDGQVIYRETKATLFPKGYVFDNEGNLITPNKYDPHTPDDSGQGVTLPSGRWYYYALFFRIGIEWVRSMQASTLLPRNTGHSDHLWNFLPPYYRYLDDQQRGGAGDGDLKRYLKVFGYELDFTRELVESWQDLYHTDFTPSTLLRRIGDNFGAPYEPSVGDIRYRALISRIGYLYRARGTTGGLRGLVAAMSKCDCDTTMSGNTMLLPDDSDFFEGTGNWVGLHPTTAAVITVPPYPTLPTNLLTPDLVRLGHGLYRQPTPDEGRGVMRVWTDDSLATRNILLTCGDGHMYSYTLTEDTNPTNDVLVSAVPKEVLPRFASKPVEPGDVYGFSISARGEVAGAVVRVGIIFFGDVGDADDVVKVELGSVPVSVTTTTWQQATMVAPVPENATYAVPMVTITNRSGISPEWSDVSARVYFSAAQLYYQGTTASVSVTEPDRYLTLAVAGELIGAASGYLMGDNPETT